MRLCRFNNDRFGLVEEGKLYDITGCLEELGGYRYPLPRHDVMIEALPRLRDRFAKAARDAKSVDLDSVDLLSPVANPGKIVAAPVNYLAHLNEVREQRALHHQNSINEIHRAGLFLKATSSLIGASQSVQIRDLQRRTDHEVEMAVVIGKPCRRVKSATALGYIAGYSIGLDITERGPEERSLRKSIDTYTVLGPWLVTPDEVSDPANLDLSIEVNGEVRQAANTRDLILGVPELIEFASRYYELRPGDILLTGTPEGVGPILPGDRMSARIQHIGTMSVKVTEG